ncbi:hypothetical protein VIGAN_04203200 [Vigna angularis var. angularis]|uniref:Uncharacterized protein n=1 Tax=Vigna angularis var. angularis TaxID=157739 RepID=A0A0S3RVI4_PHAAN|nr:hypothetical protein VIGAN_04203200 [Vigna angularis var. angularis]
MPAGILTSVHLPPWSDMYLPLPHIPVSANTVSEDHQNYRKPSRQVLERLSLENRTVVNVIGLQQCLLASRMEKKYARNERNAARNQDPHKGLRKK